MPLTSVPASPQSVFSGAMMVNRLRLRNDYIASPNFMPTVGWRQTRPNGMAHDLALVCGGKVEPNHLATITLIGCVLPEGLAAMPSGSYVAALAGHARGYDKGKPEPQLWDAKFIVLVGIRILLGTICDGGDGDHFLKTQAGCELCFRFGQKIFVQRVAGADGLAVDDETRNWAVEPELKEKLEALFPIHVAQPMAYLSGAIVEVTFTLQHFAFKDKSNKDGPRSHTIMANIEQIIIHCLASTPITSPFRLNRLTRPYIPVVPVLDYDSLQQELQCSPTRGEHLNAASMFVPRSGPALLEVGCSAPLLSPDSPTVSMIKRSRDAVSDDESSVVSSPSKKAKGKGKAVNAVEGAHLDNEDEHLVQDKQGEVEQVEGEDSSDTCSDEDANA